MTGQKFIVSTLVGAVTLFVVGFLIYGVALMSYLEANTMAGLAKAEPDWVMLVLGNVASAGLLSTAIGTWAKSGGAADGLRIGLQLGLLMALSVDLTIYATSHVFNSLTAMAVDAAAYTVMMTIGGAAVGAAIGRRA